MSDNGKGHDGEEEEFRFDTTEFDQLRADSATFIKQRLIIWAIRWTIGFALIFVIVAYWPSLSWLWWAGGIVALASLVFLLAGQWFIGSRIDRTTDRVRKAEAEIREIERAEREEQRRELD